MNAVVQPIFTPDVAAMRQHVEHLFGGYLDGCHDGLIELSWTDTKPDQAGRYRLAHAKLFGTDKLDELVDEAARLNAQPMCNVYIGAALRHPDTAPFGRAQDRDAWALTCAYADLDDAEAATNAKNIYGLDKPTLVVVTGRAPHTRAQLWWRLEEPLKDATHWPALLRGFAAKLHGDPTVTNPSRVMRLAGTIAWPVKPGRTVELTSIAPLREPGAREYSAEHLAREFPPVAPQASVAVPAATGHTTNSLGLADKINDGREAYMRDTISACLIELVGTTGASPTAQELYDAAWPQYERKVDLSRGGRGPDEFAQKCAYTIARFERGDIRGIETLDKAIAVYQRKEARKPVKETRLAELPPLDPNKPLILSSAQFVAGFRPPEYLINGIVQQSYLYSLTARTGHGKTAVGMYMAQSVARGVKFHNHDVKQGAVLFLAGENPDDVRARYLVLADHHRFDPTDVPFHFIDGVIDLASNMARIREEAERIPNLSLVIVDTAAAYFRGDDGNNNVQQGEFARLLRQLTFLAGKPAVVVPCHPVKNAAKDNLLPVGGGAFLNEVDGNLTLWGNAEKQTTLHWQGKFRGPEFEPMPFEMRTVECARVVDANGAVMPSVVAEPISQLALERSEAVQESDENLILKIIAASPRASLSQIGDAAKFTKSKVQRILSRLVDDKLLAKHRNSKYRLTEKGKKEIGVASNED
jgi:predicted transcriptional regulator